MPPLKRIFLIDHPRAKDGIRRIGEEGLREREQLLRGVLAIAVDECQDIEAVFNGVMVAQLLVAAIPLDFRVPQDRHADVAPLLLVFRARLKRLVLGGIIDD